MQRRDAKNRLLSTREVQRFDTWNVRTLRGLGKLEQQASEMKRYNLRVLPFSIPLRPRIGNSIRGPFSAGDATKQKLYIQTWDYEKYSSDTK